MKFIKKIHDDILDLVSKELGVHVSHSKIDNYLHRAQMGKFVELIGSEKNYQPGRPIPPIAYPSTFKVHNDLRPFITKPTSVAVDANGQFTLPKVVYTGNDYDVRPAYNVANFATYDYIYLNSLRTIANKPVDLLFEHEWADRVNSHIDTPSVTEPVATIYEDFVQIYPVTVSTLYFSCLRAPVPPNYSYTVDGNGRENAWNQSGSTDLEWGEQCHTDIIARALYFISAPLRDVFLNQVSEKKIKTDV